MSLFATDYTWTGGGGDDHGWRTPANWGRTDNKYPVSGDRIIFTNCNALIEVELGATNNYEAVSYVRIMSGASVRFYAADPSATTRFDMKNTWEFTQSGVTGYSVEFDHVRAEGGKDMTLASGASLTARNGSELLLGKFGAANAASVTIIDSTVSSGNITANGSVGTVISIDNSTWSAGDFTIGGNTTNLLSNGSTLSVGQFIVTGSAPNSLFSLDDSTVTTRNSVQLGTSNPGGGHFVFKGANPVFTTTGTGAEFKSWNNNAGMTGPFLLDFEVPEGGFAEPPIQWIGARPFRTSGNNPASYIQFRVLSSSPAISAGTTTDCPLMFSPQNGLTTGKISNGDDAAATFRFTDMTGAVAATGEESAKALYATIGSGPAATPAAAHGALSTYTKTDVARHAITAYGYATALATPDATRVELWCGTANNAGSMAYVDTVEPAALGEFSATYTAAEDVGEVTHYFQWRLFDIDPSTGATNHTAASAIFNATTKDTTTYTWQAVNGDWDGDWTDAAHWATDYASAYGYPQTGNATAKFPAGHATVVTISANTTVGTLDLTANANLTDAANAYGVDVTFRGAAETGTNRVLTVSSSFNVKSALGTVTLDNAAVKVSGTTLEPKRGKTIRLVNGADLYSNPVLNLFDGSSLELSGHSTANIGGFYIAGNGSTLTIDDSRLTIRGESPFHNYGGGSRIVFKGDAPLLYISGNVNTFYWNGNIAHSMVFNVPAGGYAAPVIQCTSSMTVNNLLRQNGKTSATLTFSIDPESPFYSTVDAIDQPLIAWSGTKAIDTSTLRYADVADGGYFMLGTSAAVPYSFTAAASFSGTAKSLGVHLVSPAHDGRLTVASDAAAELEGFTPALGTVATNGTVEAAAPASYVADGVRHYCTGYTLTEYVAGTADTVSGTPETGSGSSVTFAMPAGGAKVEWHYATDYAVSVTVVNDANGAVAKSADYVSASSPVTLTASTTTPGMEFQYWYGDVAWSNRYDNPLTVSGDAAKNICAFFGATAGNGATRTLSYNGNVGKDWFDTAAWTGGVIPGTNDTAVLVNTSNNNLHQSQNKGRVIAPSFAAVGNLVVSNAVLFVGARYARYDGNLNENNNNSNPAQYWEPDQNGNYCYKLSVSYDETRTEPVGLDVFGDVVLDSYNRSHANGNSGGAVFVGGTAARCPTRVNVAGDLDIVNGAFQVIAGYPFDFVPDASQAVDGGVTEFDNPQEFFRGSNFLKVDGTTRVRAPTATKVHNFLQVGNDFRTGVAVWLDLNDVEVGEGGCITSFFGGYGSFNAQGVSGDRTYSCCPGGHQTGDSYDGGSHGGLGGKGNGTGVGYDNPTTTTTTYDYELTPMFPGSRCGGNGSDRGSGSIRLDCATLDLRGGLIATGRSGGKGGAAGGSIWVVCDAFNAGDNAQVFADGGNKNCGGGGGRIAICEGLTPEQVDELFATHEAPQDVTVTELSDKLGARTTVAGGTGTVGTYSKGYPGTACYLVNTAGKKTLTVAGDPANLGSPTPAYGPQIFDEGDEVEISAPEAASVSDDNRSRRVAVGYTLTDTATGDVVADSSATSDILTIDGDYTLTWKLTMLQHSVDVGVETAGGTITTNSIGAADSVWQGDGTALSVTAVPASGYRFAGWFGEIAEAVQYDATLSTNVTGALRVSAVFVSDDADTATWTGAGDGASFLDAANWSTGKVPGPGSDVVIGSGASVTVAAGLVFNVKSLSVASGASLSILPEGSYDTTSWDPRLYPESVSIFDWHDCGIVASGDITVAGTLVAGRRDSAADARVVAGGAFAVAEGASVTVSGGYRLDLTATGAKETPALWRVPSALASAGGAMTVDGELALCGEHLSGSPCKVAAGTLVVGATGSLHSDSGGWGRSQIGGANVYYSYDDMGGSYNGGAYGGFGGGYNNNPALVTQYGNRNTYGEALRPYLPGSQGGNWNGALGGGALRIDVAGRVSNNGTISANGKDVGGSTGGGSGGGIWITCHKFVNGAEGSLLARGGNNTNNGGAGGGGRILVCENLTAEQVDALYATGVAPARVTATEVTDANAAEVFAGTVSAAGGTNVNNSASNPYWSGTAGSIWRLAGKATKFVFVVR